MFLFLFSWITNRASILWSGSLYFILVSFRRGVKNLLYILFQILILLIFEPFASFFYVVSCCRSSFVHPVYRSSILSTSSMFKSWLSVILLHRRIRGKRSIVWLWWQLLSRFLLKLSLYFWRLKSWKFANKLLIVLVDLSKLCHSSSVLVDQSPQLLKLVFVSILNFFHFRSSFIQSIIYILPQTLVLCLQSSYLVL